MDVMRNRSDISALYVEYRDGIFQWKGTGKFQRLPDHPNIVELLNAALDGDEIKGMIALKFLFL